MLAYLAIYISVVLAAADRCFIALKNIKPEGHRKKKAKEEVSSLFKRKIGKFSSKCSWKHRFVCLAYCDQYKIPTSDVEKDDLLRAGLGEKEVVFESLDLDADEFKKVLYEAYPQLEAAGWFSY